METDEKEKGGAKKFLKVEKIHQIKVNSSSEELLISEGREQNHRKKKECIKR